MAASRIKGITVEIGGDTTKLQTALKGVNSEIKNTHSLVVRKSGNYTTQNVLDKGYSLIFIPSYP
ncbi:MAG: hypothetical protein VZR23_05690 [Lachnospiraceae bacterium]|jgi:phage-related minor tail protein|nr:hypothetical protein [Lachnospiraceae bacterium]